MSLARFISSRGTVKELEDIIIRSLERDATARGGTTETDAVIALHLGVQLLQNEPPASFVKSLSDCCILRIEKNRNGNESYRQIITACLESPLLRQEVLSKIESKLVLLAKAQVQSPKSASAARYNAYLDPSIKQPLEESPDISRDQIECYLQFLKGFLLMVADEKRMVEVEWALFSAVLVLVGIPKHSLSSNAVAVLTKLLALRESGTVKISDVPEGATIDSQIDARIDELLQSSNERRSNVIALRIWAQWKSLPKALVLNQKYWHNLQKGMSLDSPEAQKLSLYILQLSLARVQSDVMTDNMIFKSKERNLYIMQYDKYCTLFETIALERYANQVEACLGDFSDLANKESRVHHKWIFILLRAAFRREVQETVRKLIGNWYVEHVKGMGPSLGENASFFIEIFLPWSCQGSLFTSTLRTQRKSQVSIHGERLSTLVSDVLSLDSDDFRKRYIVSQILQFVIAKGDKLFPYAAIYLFDGVKHGLNGCRCLESQQLDMLVKISRHFTIAAVARDLLLFLCAELMDLKAADSKISPETQLALGKIQMQRNLLASRKGSNTVESADGNINTAPDTSKVSMNGATQSLENILVHIKNTRYQCLHGHGLLDTCHSVLNALDLDSAQEVQSSTTLEVLRALCDEAEIQEFPTAEVLLLPKVLLHPTCMAKCDGAASELARFIRKMVHDLLQLSTGKIFVLYPLIQSIRLACLDHPDGASIVNVSIIVVKISKDPPFPKPDFVFEMIMSEKLHNHVPHRDYYFYYGREPEMAYACLFDLLCRFGPTNITVCEDIVDQLLSPWLDYQQRVRIRSKWKNSMQLQVMLILMERCLKGSSETKLSSYLQDFTKVLAIEPTPRYRFLLEWIIFRLYTKRPHSHGNLLEGVSPADQTNPKYTTSMVKIAVSLCGLSDASEDYCYQIMKVLVPLGTSPKVAIRYEAQWSVPLLWDVAETRGWRSITGDSAFAALNDHIRSLEKYKTPYIPRERETFNPSKDHTLANLFDGKYLELDPFDPSLVETRDFHALWRLDQEEHNRSSDDSSFLIPLGSVQADHSSASLDPISHAPTSAAEDSQTTSTSSQNLIPLQTKSSKWESILSTDAESPDSRPTTLILVASLIDNPFNLGGLSRCAEIFGAQSLAVRDTRVTADPSFTSVAVTSHQHLPITSVPVSTLPDYLTSCKRDGYTVVGVEQTDQSLVLGDPWTKLPKKVALVLGSESKGVPVDVLRECDVCVEVSQVGVTRSLNVQTAASVVLYEYQRQHHLPSSGA